MKLKFLFSENRLIYLAGEILPQQNEEGNIINQKEALRRSVNPYSGIIPDKEYPGKIETAKNNLNKALTVICNYVDEGLLQQYGINPRINVERYIPLMVKESALNNDVQSWAGAYYGYFQMGSSAASHVKKIFNQPDGGINRFQPFRENDRKDPLNNCIYGILYYHICLDYTSTLVDPSGKNLSLNNRQHLALLGYNGGVGTVQTLWNLLQPKNYADFENKLAEEFAKQLGIEHGSPVDKSHPAYSRWRPNFTIKQYPALSRYLELQHEHIANHWNDPEYSLNKTFYIGGQATGINLGKVGEMMDYVRVIEQFALFHHGAEEPLLTPIDLNLTEEDYRTTSRSSSRERKERVSRPEFKVNPFWNILDDLLLHCYKKDKEVKENKFAFRCRDITDLEARIANKQALCRLLLDYNGFSNLGNPDDLPSTATIKVPPDDVIIKALKKLPEIKIHEEKINQPREKFASHADFYLNKFFIPENQLPPGNPERSQVLSRYVGLIPQGKEAEIMRKFFKLIIIYNQEEGNSAFNRLDSDNVDATQFLPFGTKIWFPDKAYVEKKWAGITSPPLPKKATIYLPTDPFMIAKELKDQGVPLSPYGESLTEEVKSSPPDITEKDPVKKKLNDLSTKTGFNIQIWTNETYDPSYIDQNLGKLEIALNQLNEAQKKGLIDLPLYINPPNTTFEFEGIYIASNNDVQIEINLKSSSQTIFDLLVKANQKIIFIKEVAKQLKEIENENIKVVVWRDLTYDWPVLITKIQTKIKPLLSSLTSNEKTGIRFFLDPRSGNEIRETAAGNKVICLDYNNPPDSPTLKALIAQLKAEQAKEEKK